MTITNVIDWPKAPPNPVQKPETPPEGQAIPRDVLIKLYEHTVAWQHHELLRKNYEVNKLKESICEYHEEVSKLREGQPRSAYEILLLLANDPTQPVNVRLRAAEACVQYERPKLTANFNANQNVNDIGTRLEAARARKLETERLAIGPDRPVWPTTAEAEPA